MNNYFDTAKIAIQVAKQIISEKYNEGKHIIFVPEGGGFIYNGKFWEVYNPKKLEKLIFDTFIKDYPDFEHKVEQIVYRAMKYIGWSCLQEEGLPEPPEYTLNVDNGELHFGPDQEITLTPHSPLSGHTWCLDVDFEPDAKALLYEQTNSEIFQACDDAEDVIRHLYEVSGYIISTSRHLAFIGMFIGPGSNGKTKTVQTLIQLMGPDSVLCKPLMAMQKDNFFDIGLMGKGLFHDDDLDVSTKLPAGKLKALSEAKQMTARPPGGKDISFVSKAVPLLLSNHLPKSNDTSDGMLRRLHLFKFDTSFLGDKQDPDRFSKIWTTEMPGILNLFIDGYRRLMKRGNFRRPDEMEIHIDEWAFQMNITATYISDACVLDHDLKIKGTDLYANFKKWSKQNGYPAVFNANEFYSQIENIGFKKTKPGNAVTFQGLRISTELEDM